MLGILTTEDQIAAKKKSCDGVMDALPDNAHFAEDTIFASTVPHQICCIIHIATCSEIILCTLAPDGILSTHLSCGTRLQQWLA
jgi:hypothetical protein